MCNVVNFLLSLAGRGPARRQARLDILDDMVARGDCKRVRRTELALALAAVSFVWPMAAQVQKAAAAGHPDLDGIWNAATATPLERPARLKDKAFFTPEEAAQWERQAAARNQDPAQIRPGSFASYNNLFYEHGTKLPSSRRTSIITDPPDGRIPALTPTAAAEMRHHLELLKNPRAATDLGLQDQCIVFSTAVPMLPYIYNSNYQIVQTGAEIMINVEMIHDTRVIRLDRQSHLPPSIQLWLGDSLGHWEGSTLVVDTTNFRDGSGYFGEAGGMYASDRNLHVIEHFSPLDANTILYRFEVEDPTVYTRPWKGELTLERSPGPMFEYACHEGNYALPALLQGAEPQKAASSSANQR
ncbi:MAG TPA: hypothetical protein VKX49_13560 [Bryobacteraceae bacterium]|nr:hypothetical protein [Bryobacteraceae bacterium]